MDGYVLRENPRPEDDSWVFTAPPNALQPKGARTGKFISFTPIKITLRMGQFPTSRITHNDDHSKFLLVSFGDLRFPDTSPRMTAEYINRLMKAGLHLNGVQYRFYHHSNSQLRSRSCFMRAANSDEELDARIYPMGDFGKIMNVAKRAKRIGLLFSSGEIDFVLDPGRTADIPDLLSGPTGDEVFSDGCGLISRMLAVELAKRKRIIFRGRRYVPTVYQIRYRGYKGVLMLHPQLPPAHLAEFRYSMRKFKATSDNTFSVVDSGYSLPYAFGRLNNDIIVLLSSLGITTETLLAKQRGYFAWVADAAGDQLKAMDFLSALGEHALAERVLLDGLEDARVQRRVRALRLKEVSDLSKKDKMRARMIVHKSRLLFGVCDPYGVLGDGEVHVRITESRQGVTTLTNADLLVVRNPCLHPGDCLKLRAVAKPELAHLIDCVVFASKGRRAAPSMTSGGDLDGDKFLVCWDQDLVPKRLAESYGYPPNKERSNLKITRADLANHFASYNNGGVARVAALHQKWARASPLGAMCVECQELNALHSQSVDGAPIKIPDRLRNPPEATEPYVIDVLAEAASEFAQAFLDKTGGAEVVTAAGVADAAELIPQLMRSEPKALSEYELFNMANALARKAGIPISRYLSYINFGALSTEEKYAVSSAAGVTPEEEPYVWNSLLRSDILTTRDLEERRLGGTLRLQRLYSSRIQGRAAFFEYLRIAQQDFTRKMIVLKTDDRFSVGIFVRGDVAWDEDPDVDENVTVCSFMPQTTQMMSTYKACTRGYKLHCGDNIFQLYNKQIADTWIFITRPAILSGQDIATSIALQKISGRVQKQIGRINRTPVVDIEIHVISNRDRVAHQLFDLRFEHVQTDEFIKNSAYIPTPYTLNSLQDVDWTNREWMQQAVSQFGSEAGRRLLESKNVDDLENFADLCVEYHALDQLYAAFDEVVGRSPLDSRVVRRIMNRFPPLVFALLRAKPPTEALTLDPSVNELSTDIVKNLIRVANDFGVATLVALEKIATSIQSFGLKDYTDLLFLASLCIRGQNTLQETLLVLHECRSRDEGSLSSSQTYAHKHALGVAFDRAEEAADECACDEQGRPRPKQNVAPNRARLLFDDEGSREHITAHIRVDQPTAVRLHSHVRLKATSKVERGWRPACVLDGIVRQGSKGELKIELLYPSPPEMERMDWNIYNAGSIANAQSMMDAILKLALDGHERCLFHRLIKQDVSEQDEYVPLTAEISEEDEELSAQGLNQSQIAAVKSCDSPLSLIWGPPGTGKTTVVVQILRRIIKKMLTEDSKVLVTASTHNAVDNILERFIKLNEREGQIVPTERIIRVATDYTKVSKELQDFTVDARVGGDPNANPRLLNKAKKRVNEALIVFTTCAGAGLGTLRSVDFDIALVDEASQVTEPSTLIPLVKGCRRAVLVGDHVQLRPTVRPMSKALLYDVSLMERLYTNGRGGISRTMLDIQYRFPARIATFPSSEFYEGNLRTGMSEAEARQVLEPLRSSAFPWPVVGGAVVPVVFVHCAAEEDPGRQSKSNTGQADLIVEIVRLLRTTAHDALENGGAGKGKAREAGSAHAELEITALSPYSRQVALLRSRLSSVPAYTIDSFQGRESDIIMFSTVRANAHGEIGFVEDRRRLNVAWTRAKRALIVVGDRTTMTSTLGEATGTWKRAIEACVQVEVIVPSTEAIHNV